VPWLRRSFIALKPGRFLWARHFNFISNAYEKGGGVTTMLHWDDAKHRLTHAGAAAWTEPDAKIVDIVHP
jgi:hypothetical protein